ncbi:DUF4444 domain-containing protein [Marinibacterium sp. SX1]|uniref:biotin/lipoate--protein ligase family protein n=1 Tax=Marinibacterium sp. SX1 TaxID=3388424 RepID=UPI003D165606
MTGPGGLLLPPLMSARACADDPARAACQAAMQGCDAGLMTWRVTPAAMQAALVFAPEVDLARAMIMLPLCGVGFQNALGALSPPEVAVELRWDGTILLNGAACGRLRAHAADPGGPAAGPPDWLVVALDLRLTLTEGGADPQITALYEEGCGEVTPEALLEAWARHTLNWIGRWEADGNRVLHEEWRGLVPDIGQASTLADHPGKVLGTDESFGLLIARDDTTHLVPLTHLLEDMP